MSLANSARITYNGEVLCCFDQTEVKAVEPFRYKKEEPHNIFKRVWGSLCYFLTGKKTDLNQDVDIHTKVSFNDGTYLILKMPFMEFVNAYC